MSASFVPTIVPIANVASVRSRPARHHVSDGAIFVQGKFDVVTVATAPWKVSISLPLHLTLSCESDDTSGIGVAAVYGSVQSQTGVVSANDSTSVFYSHAATAAGLLSTVHYSFSCQLK